MKSRSVQFFDEQFRRQVTEQDFSLNPFEKAILPFLSGDILDLGCGLGNLAVVAATTGCRVTALDASPTAVRDLRRRAAEGKLSITAKEADLQNMDVQGEFDCVVSIGLLMLFPPQAARKALARIKDLVRPEGLAAVNVLIEGTTFMDMFDPAGYCLFGESELPEAFDGWVMEHSKLDTFSAPQNTVKRFCTVVARRPKATLCAS
jgi:tellurite methyltransferase